MEIKYLKKKIALIAIFSILFNMFLPINSNITYGVSGPTGTIDNASGSFLLSTGSIGLSNLIEGGVYEIMSGSTVVSSGVLIADASLSGSLELNPMYFSNYGSYNLTLSGTYLGNTNSNIDNVLLYIGFVDFQDLYVNQVSPALSASGVYSNLGDITYSNVMSFPGLYFEQTGLGKIDFSGSLDLTDSGTISFLQNLPNYLNMDNGYIELTGEEFSNYPATIHMYDMPLSLSGTSLSSNNFAIKDNSGNTLNASGLISNIETDCSSGTGCNVIFNTAHFTSFDLKPILTNVSIISDNASGSLAKVGDTITLNFTGSESLTGVSVTFNGGAAASINGSGNIWTASSDIISSGNGLVNFVINYSDLTGNTGSTSTTTDGTSVEIDTINPVLVSKQIKNITETSVDFEINFSEENFAGQDGNISVTLGEVPKGPYSIVFSGSVGTATFDSLSADTNYNYSLSLTDDAGNNTTSTGTFSTAAGVSGTGEIVDTGAVSFGFTGNLSSGSLYTLSDTNLIINSDSNDSNFLTGTLSLSGINIIVSSGSWNGILIPPTLIDTNSQESATGSEIGTGITVIQTIKSGAEGASLSSSGGYFGVSFIVNGYSSGTSFNIYRSDNGSSWLLNTPDSTCTLDQNHMCSFRTDHMSYFSPVFDSTPDNFSFTSLTNKDLSTSYESNTITISGINTGATISITGGEYKIGTGSYTSATGTINNGESIIVKLTSSSSYSTTTTASLTIGGVSAGFSVTTKASSSGGGGGGIIKDNCPGGDKSGNYYDGICGKALGNKTGTGIILDKPNLNKNYFFIDLNNSFAKSYVEILSHKGVLKVYSGRLFLPSKKITRGEFLALAMKTFEINLNSTGSNTFTDIPTSRAWMIPYLIKAKELGIIGGQSIDGKLIFRPNQPISRIEALAILFKLAKLDTSSTITFDFTDSDFQNWMIPYVKKAHELKITDGQRENGKLKFKPNSTLTRAEASKFIVKFLDFIK